MKTLHTVDELIQHIQQQYQQFTPQFKKAARYLLDHPNHVSTLSARKLAALADVQPATLVRLAQHLGFSGWDTLKSLFTRELQIRPYGYTARAQSLVERPLANQLVWHESAREQSKNINALEVDNEKSINAAIDLLNNSQRICIAGFRSSYAPAFSLYYLLSLFRQNVYLLHNTGGTMSLDLHHLRTTDTLILIGYTPYAREIAKCAYAAKEQGCKLLALADSKLAPFALHANCILTFKTEGNSFFPSTVAIQSLVELLAQQLLIKNGEKAIAELTQTESRLHSNEAYL